MKYNLKNRPREIESIRYDWWFEGFERELREIRKYEGDANRPFISAYDFIKEILGE